MKIKRYEGQYVHEVIAHIREELGSDAVVLHTRWRSPSGLKRLLSRPKVEVWAGIRDEGEPAPAANGAGVEPLASRALALKQALEAHANGAGLEPPATNGHGPAVALAEPPATDADPLMDDILDVASDTGELAMALWTDVNASIARLEEKVDELARAREEKAAQAPAPRLRALLDLGVRADVAAEVVAAAEGKSVSEALLDSFQCTGEVELGGGPKVVALVGPSGVGKTTTLAKLAAHFALVQHARVVLCSSDTKRVGTFEQIRAVGDLMQLPTSAIRPPAEASQRIELARRNSDVVLLDTAAAMPGRDPDWSDLVDMLIAVEPDEIHLVVSATLRAADLAHIVDGFRKALPLRGVVVTKLDESVEPGGLVDLAWRHLTPLSYLGVGPNVPGDLETATPDALLARVWSTRLANLLRE
ncbi:MAG: hypothetical protein HYU66_18655 [Armatimonadetes bacterium]|nr:hypothetical protein [Armatimonadota bacterium]